MPGPGPHCPSAKRRSIAPDPKKIPDVPGGPDGRSGGGGSGGGGTASRTGPAGWSRSSGSRRMASASARHTGTPSAVSSACSSCTRRPGRTTCTAAVSRVSGTGRSSSTVSRTTANPAHSGASATSVASSPDAAPPCCAPGSHWAAGQVGRKEAVAVGEKTPPPAARDQAPASPSGTSAGGSSTAGLVGVSPSMGAASRPAEAPAGAARLGPASSPSPSLSTTSATARTPSLVAQVHHRARPAPRGPAARCPRTPVRCTMPVLGDEDQLLVLAHDQRAGERALRSVSVIVLTPFVPRRS